MSKFVRVAALALLATTSTSAFADDNAKREIVVTGRSLADTEADLKACLARGCPPDEDIKATLAHAENQFVDGGYKSSRATLLASLARNRKHREQFPVEISDLLRANGNVASHLGEAEAYRNSVLDMRDTLKNGLKSDDYRILGAELEVGDSRFKLGYPEEAEDKYTWVEKTALAQGKPWIAAVARIRNLSMAVSIAQTGKDPYRVKKAYRELDEYIANPTPGAPQYAIVAEVLKSRLDRKTGDSSSTDALIARYAALGGTNRPVLLHANPIQANESSAARAAVGGGALNRIAMDSFEKRWVDIGFWIGADGKVDEPEIIRNEGRTEWTDEVIKSIQSRIYAPLKADDSGTSPGVYAVERYTLTAHWESDVTGSRIRQRSPVPRIERIDLTE